MAQQVHHRAPIVGKRGDIALDLQIEQRCVTCDKEDSRGAAPFLGRAQFDFVEIRNLIPLVATKLEVGHPGSVSRLLSAGRADKDLSVKRDALTRTFFTDEKSNR